MGGPNLSNEVAVTFELVEESNDTVVSQVEVGGDLNRRSEDTVKGSVRSGVLDDHLGENEPKYEPEDEEIVDYQYMSSDDEELQDARKALKQFKENKRRRHKAAIGNEDAI
ncbi:conserved hypothetical protein [Ricinus communis]|uniref:Uncharacterized protein n=1 Tax=Ricinus communis TaxID=3988 RepID=B9SEK3_RICCO|nr:conserved hypothetical protein [Ricinus communis]